MSMGLKANVSMLAVVAAVAMGLALTTSAAFAQKSVFVRSKPHVNVSGSQATGPGGFTATPRRSLEVWTGKPKPGPASRQGGRS
jgi:hypothetical protein